MTLYQKIAEKLQFISPEFYKKRYFKKLEELSADNFSEKNMEPELLWIKDYIPKAAVFFDIGANVGTYLFRLEKRLSPHQIYAFEPNPKLYFRLKRIFPEMHIYRLALSDKNETADFKIPVINGETYNSRGTLHTQFFENGEENHFTEKVKVMKLDDWAGLENLKRLDFIKIDVEGNEMETLRGAEKTIKKFKPVLMVEMEQRHHEKPLQQMVSEIENWNYTAHFLNRENFRLQKIEDDFYKIQKENELINKNQYINNIIFVPNYQKKHNK